MAFAPIKLVYEASGGDYTQWFRWFHVAQMAATVGLFVALLRVRSWTDAAVAPLALAACVGLHTFGGTIREAFPVNGYLTIVGCCLAAAVVAAGRPRWWSAPCAVGVLLFASLSVESGLLVWVVLVAGFAAGWRGVPRWGVVLATLCVAAYFVGRFVLLDVGTPGLDGRSTGFGLQILEPEQVISRFGANPQVLYAYNVLASASSVLFAEPRGGVFWVARGLTFGSLQPWTVINIMACSSLTGFIVWFVASGRHRWRNWSLVHGDRLVLVFAAVLVANAAMNYVYTKDVIMSPAGAFFGLAGYAAVREFVTGLPGRRPRAALVASICVAVCAGAWGIKAAGVHYGLRGSASTVRWEWVEVDTRLSAQGVTMRDRRERAIKEALEADALWRRPARSRIRIAWPWPGELFDPFQ